jgi:DeoR family transcriptional regulator of aga operon
VLSVDRRRETYELLLQRGSARIADIAAHLSVSPQTVRRDLDSLAADGLVRRVHGGAVVDSSGDGGEGPQLERAALNRAEKRRIGALAAARVTDGETIFLSGGTTTEHVVPWLEHVRRLTVITNAVNIAYLLGRHPDVQVIVLTGTLRHTEMTLLGQLAEDAVADFRIDHALYGCYALDPDEGLYGASLAEASMDRRVVAAADRLTVLADHSKFGRRGPVQIAAVSRITTLITGRGAPEDAVARLRGHGVEVELA